MLCKTKGMQPASLLLTFPQQRYLDGCQKILHLHDIHMMGNTENNGGISLEFWVQYTFAGTFEQVLRFLQSKTESKGNLN